MTQTAEARTLSCSACKAEKPVTDFYTNKRFTRGYQYHCKDCCKAHARQWDRDHPERHREHSRKSHHVNRDAQNARRARWHQNNPDGAYKSLLRTRYGLDWTTYCEMLLSQGNRCAVCRTDTPGGKSRWHVDHDHVTGVVRALLCAGCNFALTKTMTPERLRALALYLEKHKWPQQS